MAQSGRQNGQVAGQAGQSVQADGKVGQPSLSFEQQIAPLLQARCVGCHGPTMQEGGLRLDLREHALRGGDTGPAIVPRQTGEGELLRRVASQAKADRMPPKGEALSAAEIELLRRWIASGAEWPESSMKPSTDRDPRLDHWAWKPLGRPTPPTRPKSLAASESTRPMAETAALLIRSGPLVIDAYVREKLRTHALDLSPEADRRTLIRRLSFDLVGLPPSAEAIERFAADTREDAYERLVDELLASPRYGERWARHWLDVVHYGDTHGYDKDKPRPNAWPYRDYVIRALNEDKPYARFVEEQVAGDTLYPGTRDGIEAMGFIAAGPWDFIGHAEVPESKTDGKIARHLDRDDMVANTLGTFCSVTIHCAQCHNHKFDPFTQEDYYSLQAVFAALDRADRTYWADPHTGRLQAELAARKRTAETRRDELEAAARKNAGPALAELDRRIAATRVNGKPGNTAVEFGYHSAISNRVDAAKWVQIDLGESRALSAIVLRPCYDDYNNIGAGFGFPARYRVELSDDPAFPPGAATVVIAARDDADQRNPGVAPERLDAGGRRGRYVRVTAVKLAPRSNDYIFALAELEAIDTEGENRARRAAVTALDSIEAGPRWGKKNLIDGHAPTAPETTPVMKLAAERDELLRRALDASSFAALESTQRELADIAAELSKLPPPSVVYAGTIHQGNGAFAGTGTSGGQPRSIAILQRGNVTQRGREVSAGAISAFPMLSGRFELPTNHREGERRAALARWLVSPRNPLTWRSIVNRVWQYHFGRGLVETSNDFGRMGTAPTHPDLLDWLACEFHDGGGSLKQLHKAIVLSATYRQSSGDGPPDRAARARSIDSDNRLLWRQQRRKLEAEAIRDAVLAVSGKLDLRMGGPGYQDFVVLHPEHSPHYEYHLADPNDPATWRRSVYRFLVRSQTQPFMTSLDCADPSMRVERRNESVSAIQALALLNNGFMVAQAAHFADRVRREAGDEPLAQVDLSVRLALGRLPTADERAALADFLRAEGLANVCRVLINLNEFAFVD
ncbi:MAG: DUF1553 domain-containing protein [Planctomycetota bacterium]